MKVMKGSMVFMKALLNTSQLYILEGGTMCSEANIASSSPHTSSARLWHLRLGHISMKGLEVLEKQKVLMGDHVEQLGFVKIVL